MTDTVTREDSTQTPARGLPRDLWLARTLGEAGLLTPLQVAERQVAGGAGIWDAVVRGGHATDEQILEAISTRFRVPIADLAAIDPRVATLLPESVARKYQIVAVGADERKIQIATADPRDLALEQTLAFVTGRAVEFQVAAPAGLSARIEELYRPDTAINRLVDGLHPVSVETIDELLPTETRDPTLDAPMARLVDAMISDAVREGASDIHCEPLPECASVRYRIDGVLKEVMRLPASAGPALVRRVKILSRLDVTDPLRPHDGRTGVRVDGKPIDLRVSTVPVARRGEKVVIRILDKANLRANVPDLDLPANEEAQLVSLLGHREGILLVTGPTGSGKTTTLYAMINQLKAGPVNIVTVEDPVEYDVPGISQLQVNEAQSFTFATALRSVLRQDPDIVLVGEIRDLETAEIAVQAGLSGHLVLSTLHTNDAPAAVVRLRDLGVDAFKIASVVKGVLAQRLVRKLCNECAKPVEPDEVPRSARPPADRAAGATFRQAAGCKACGGTGYRGRVAVFEIMEVNDEMARLISEGAMADTLLASARPHGMATLWESALDRVWKGLTSLEEATRVLGDLASAAEPPPHAVPGGRVAPPMAGEPTPLAAAVPGPRRPAAAAAAAADADGSGPTRVLVADDDRQMRRLIRMILERDGHQVIEAADGLDAIDLIEANRFDLMILDLDMPRLDGLGVLEELRSRILTASVPVIVLTARTEDSEVQVLDLGAQDFLTKPVQPQSLQARVRAVMRRTRMG